MIIRTSLLKGIVIGLLAVTACSPSPKVAELALATPEIQQVLISSPKDLFRFDNQLLTTATFDKAVNSLAPTTQINDINQLLYFLRAYSYFGDIKALTAEQKHSLSKQLQRLTTVSELKQNPRFQEQFAVTLYRYFDKDDAAESLQPLLKPLKSQLLALSTAPISQATDYALWETLRAYGFLLNQAKKQPDGALAKTLIKQRVHLPLISFAKHTNSIRQQSDWPKQNAYWALALYRLTLPASDTDKPTKQEQEIDDAVASIADADIKQRNEQAKDAYTLGYHINTFALRQACIDNENRCRIPDESTLLPLTHSCSATIIIRHQDLTSEQLTESCQRLTSQESDFHQMLDSQKQPTANDHNTTLEVVVFKNWSQYHIGGQLLFDINTDNGGMYLEGTPQKPGNQARFLAFRQWWVEPEFSVWNLNHEYVHYLDGRFVKYGEFGHFPSHMVWWAEGLAEYISKGNDNPKALKVATETNEERPTLKTIFATEYGDGLKRTYQWSYLAIRYLSEHHPQEMVNLSQALKADIFVDYQAKLTELENHNEAFQAWLTALLKADTQAEENKKPKVNKLNRYSYRDYLNPSHFVADKMHRHY
ncbi:collagenase [Parashewanella curva]|uniref:collagenase n=1 Tax=Parashewanella curva TaxID=2338552 RepID=UPI001FB25C3D|nr:collagenase [Parashewanella curva]